MQLIYKATLSYILAILFSTVSFAETVSGNLSCLATNADDVKTVVVFLNGIKNTLDEAETSRQLLKKKLGNVCNKPGCVVQKFYNKMDGFDDLKELNFVGGLERDSADHAFRRLVKQIKNGYLRYKSSIEKNHPDFNVDIYKKNDEKVWKELERLYNKAKDSSSDSQIKFYEAGTKITEWLINHLLLSEDIPSPDNSIYLASMKERSLLYDAMYKQYYYSVLIENYLSKKDYYGSDANVNKTVTKTVDSLVTYLETHMLSGKKIVVVAHSQGNHMIELAYGVLKQKWGSSPVQSIKVVGVASVASTTPNDTYLTWDGDNVVLQIYDSFSDGDPLVGNFSATDESPVDGAHDFSEVYLNHKLKGRYHPNGRGNLSGVQEYLSDANTEYPVDDWIIGLIKGSIDVAIPYCT